MKNKNIIIGILIGVIIVLIATISVVVLNKDTTKTIKVDLSSLSLSESNKTSDLKIYTLDDYETFLSDYNSKELPSVYVTKFLFDGVSTYKTYDLDDFIEGGNDINVESFEITAININTTGNIELSGEITGGMIAVDTNDVSGNINIILNGVKIDTDSKKVPAVYVYNKDITSTSAKVTISASEDTKNYIEGGKLKKVSLVPSDKLSDYSGKYTNENKTNYETYTNYYGIYTSSEVSKILFATVQADNEDLADGDPYLYYKASGAISSDIDLYFEGSGYLEVTSKNKEGIETKGNLTFAGGIGDYVVSSQDDCLNTTTDSKEVTNARNTLTIDVNSLYAIVSLDATEGDAIDSNGELIINGGTIVAIAKPGSDAGIDSENGTYINGGVVIATGDMYDEVRSDSKQNFIVLSFGQRTEENDLITLLDSSDNVIFAYKTDRTFTNLIYSSSSLTNNTYYLYKNGNIVGTQNNGYYTSISSYEKGTQLGYSTKGNVGGMQGQMNNNGERPELPDGNTEQGAQFNGDMAPSQDTTDNRPTPPSGDNNFNPNDGNTPPEKPDGNTMEQKDANMPFESATNQTTSNKEFVIDGISNLFSGVATYSE